MTTANPFEILDQRLTSIERILSLMQNTQQAPAPEPTDQMIGIEEVAALLRCPKPTVYQKAKHIAHFRHGKRLLFQKSDVLKYLETYKIESIEDRRVIARQKLQERASK